MEKVLYIGKKPIKCGAYRTENHRVFIEVRLSDKGALGLSGVIGPLQSGNARGSCGQVVDELTDIIPVAPWTRESITELVSVWRKWHLNDMRAGCEHQRSLGWDNSKLSEPCPTCGYKYGTAWLREELPATVIEWFEELPETTIPYPWG